MAAPPCEALVTGNRAFTTGPLGGAYGGPVTLAVISGIGPMELGIVLVIGLLVLGPKRLPQAGRALGQGMREFKDGISGRTLEEPSSQQDAA